MNVQFVTGRLAILLMVAALLLVPVSSARMMAAARSFDQSLVTVKAKDASLSDILWEIHKQTDFTFVYSTDDIGRVVLPSLDLREVTLQKALEACLDSNGLTYTVNGEVITIKLAPSSVKPEGEPVKQDKKYYTGSVVDDAGIPVAGANILVKGAGIGSVSDAEGNFSIQYDVDSAIVVVSFIGFTTREVRMSPGIPAEIILMQDLNMMDEVHCDRIRYVQEVCLRRLRKQREGGKNQGYSDHILHRDAPGQCYRSPVQRSVRAAGFGH